LTVGGAPSKGQIRRQSDSTIRITGPGGKVTLFTTVHSGRQKRENVEQSGNLRHAVGNFLGVGSKKWKFYWG